MGLETKQTGINKEKILSKVSELDIFEAFCPTRFSLNKPFSSPFRKDSNPSFVIHYKNGYYYFADYGNLQYRGDALDFVKLMTNSGSFMETLRNVNSVMNLKLDTEKPVEVSIRKKEEEEQPEEANDESKLIQCQIKRFTKESVSYWNNYSLSLDDLKSHKDVQTYMIDRVWIDKKLFYINYDELCFGYFFDEKYWKIYRPHADVSKGEWKWISNVPLKHMYGLDNLEKGKPAIGAKSVKDFMVLRKLKKEICGTQNESLAAISEENAAFISENCSQFYIGFDSDEAGVRASTELCNLRDYLWVNPPRWMLKFDTKDFSDMDKNFSLESVEYHLKCKNLL